MIVVAIGLGINHYRETDAAPAVPYASNMIHSHLTAIALPVRTLLHLLRRLVGSDRLFMSCITTLAFAGRPNAQRAWRWYQTGDGRPLRICVRDLWYSDSAAAAFAAQQIEREQQSGQTAGRLWIDQRRMSSRDWRYALGGVWLHWQSDEQGGVALRVAGEYAWAPHQPRITQALHAAASHHTQWGAQPFAIESDAMRVSRRTLEATRQCKIVRQWALI